MPASPLRGYPSSPPSVSGFLTHLETNPSARVLTPLVSGDNRLHQVWLGNRWSPRRLLAGRMPSPLWNHSRTGSWVFSECLFFRRPALWERLQTRRRPSKRRLFLWRLNHPKIIRVPEMRVHKKT